MITKAINPSIVFTGRVCTSPYPDTSLRPSISSCCQHGRNIPKEIYNHTAKFVAAPNFFTDINSLFKGVCDYYGADTGGHINNNVFQKMTNDKKINSQVQFDLSDIMVRIFGFGNRYVREGNIPSGINAFNNFKRAMMLDTRHSVPNAQKILELIKTTIGGAPISSDISGEQAAFIRNFVSWFKATPNDFQQDIEKIAKKAVRKLRKMPELTGMVKICL